MGLKEFGSRTTADEVLCGLDLHDKQYIVTGSNIGIGYETARALAAAGAQVIFACRSLERGQAAVASTIAAHPGAKARSKVLDLASFESIRTFCQELEWKKVDGLICNAGVFPSHYATTDEGLEMTAGVCHFGHFLLAHLLVAKLKRSNDGRLVVVASESHRQVRRFSLDMFPISKTKFFANTAYCQAKFANMLFTQEFHRRYGQTGVTACCLHPGSLVTTNLAGDYFPAKILFKITSLFTKTANQGAATSVFCAAYASTEELAGNYFSHCRAVNPTRLSQSEKLAQQLWAMSEDFCLKQKEEYTV